MKTHISIRYSTILALAFASGFWPTSASSQPSVVGEWGSVLYWPYDPACYGGASWLVGDGANGSVHTHLLPTGKVMIYPFQDCPRLWDPANELSAPVSLPKLLYNAFCGGHSYIPDGRLLVNGGTTGGTSGDQRASYFNPFDPFNPNNAWQPLPPMGPDGNWARWYPSSTTLANGDVLVTSGWTSAGGLSVPPPALPGDTNDLPQVWQVANNTWRNLTGAIRALPLYPRTFLAPNGKVFFASDPSEFLDTAGTGAWSGSSNPPWSARPKTRGHEFHGTPAIMDHTGKVYWLGGSDPCITTAQCEMIDLNAPSPQWTCIAPMPGPGRKYHNAVILPDGKFLVVGGRLPDDPAGPDNGCNQHFNDGGKAALLYDPLANTWTTLAPEARYRGYHSCAILLPDGRVLSNGGDMPRPSDPNAQIFSPPYLFNGTRPTITSAPTSVGYAQTFFVATPNGASIAKVTWTRIGSVTHSFDNDHRINVLNFTQVANGLNVTAPGNPILCPPGYYLLWILNGSGVPSVSKMVQITAPPQTVTITATDATASETGNEQGSFRVMRTGNTSAALTVYFTIGGTALNGTDYSTYSSLTIPAGASSAQIPVTPLEDATVEGSETVILTLSANANYVVGPPSSATVSIFDNDLNWVSRATGPSGRAGHTLVLANGEVIVWGGGADNAFLNTGSRHNVANNTWTTVSTTGAPSARWFHSAVWTGTEMLIWGGRANFYSAANVGTGAAYNPATGTWRTINPNGAPSARSQMSAVWTGKEMIVWGGAGDSFAETATGARYNPQTDSWTAMAVPTLAPRLQATAVWTGTEMIVFGGLKVDGSPEVWTSFGDGARYDPACNTWAAISAVNAPSSRTAHTAVWTGAEMIVWGGRYLPPYTFLNSGGRYNPATDSWAALPSTGAPQARADHAAVWTGTDMIIWGGYIDPTPVEISSGATYNRASNAWTPTPSGPTARYFGRNDGAVWTPQGMFYYGGWGDYPDELDSAAMFRYGP